MNQLTMRSRRIVIVAGLAAVVLTVTLVLLLTVGTSETPTRSAYILLALLALAAVGALALIYSRLHRPRSASMLTPECNRSKVGATDPVHIGTQHVVSKSCLPESWC